MTARNCLTPLPIHLVAEAVRAALAEDLGLVGDITTNATVAADARATATIGARAAGVISGLELAREAFRALDPKVDFQQQICDGEHVAPGAVVATVQGSARAILSGERVALNFLGRLSGIATLTRAYVEKVRGSGATIVDTRKTTPGLRAFEKYAVRSGGGGNHRTGLFDAVLIKDNHIVAAGGLTKAISRVNNVAGHMIKIEVEVDTLDQLKEVLELSGFVDAVLLDNMTTEDLRAAVELAAGRVVCEASGGVSLETVSDIAGTGVDIISVGALTHSAQVLDVGLDFSK